MLNKVKEIAENLGWDVKESDNDDDIITLTFSKGSPAGQDFSFEVDFQNEDIELLCDEIYAYYSNYDCSYEAYIWLGNDGHGKNGAPYDMKDIYEDMEACQDNVYELWEALLRREFEC